MAKGWILGTHVDIQRLSWEGSFSYGWRQTAWGYESRFGKVEQRVQLKADGAPDFDRMVYSEAPNVNAVVWGYDKDGNIRIAVTVQARPFADNTDGTPADPPIIFGQPCVMGFNLERVAGADAAVREASEEAGTESAVVGKPISLGYHNPNPTFCATWSELYSIQVDLSKVTTQTDRSELIYRAEYVPVAELLQRISLGVHKDVNYRSATANDAFFVWLTNHLSSIVVTRDS